MSFVTTHILDTAAGRPAEGLTVTLTREGEEIARGVTDADGRITDFGPDRLETGTYTLTFDTAGYYSQGAESGWDFFAAVSLNIRLDADADHYHIPLLLSPFSISSYRGS